MGDCLAVAEMEESASVCALNSVEGFSRRTGIRRVGLFRYRPRCVLVGYVLVLDARLSYGHLFGPGNRGMAAEVVKVLFH